jgi:hypothetical protein
MLCSAPVSTLGHRTLRPEKAFINSKLTAAACSAYNHHTATQLITAHCCLEQPSDNSKLPAAACFAYNHHTATHLITTHRCLEQPSDNSKLPAAACFASKGLLHTHSSTHLIAAH